MVLRLSAAERESLLAAMTADQNDRVTRRIIGILALGSGQDLAQAAATAGLSPTTLHVWATRYAKRRSPEELKSARSLRMRHDEIYSQISELMATSPESHGYGAEAWTARMIRTHLASERGLVIPRPIVERSLLKFGSAPVPPETKAPR